MRPPYTCDACHTSLWDSWKVYRCTSCEADRLIAGLNGNTTSTPVRMAFAVGTLVLNRVWYVGRRFDGSYYVEAQRPDRRYRDSTLFGQAVADELDRRGLVGGAP